MATYAVTALKILNSPDGYVALKPDEGFCITKSFGRKHNLATHAFANLETPVRNAIETLAAEILCHARDGVSGLPEQKDWPMQSDPPAFATITKWRHDVTEADPS